MKPVAALAAGCLWLLSCYAPALAASATRVSAFEYDATSGLLTKEIVEPDNNQLRLETLYTYDSFGNKTAATVSSPATGQAAIVSRSSTTSFDANGRFATGSANALGQSETRVFDSRFGGVTSLTGPNALTTTWIYDSFGRKTLETRADGTKTRFEYLYCSGVNGGTATCPTGGKYLTRTTPLASDGTTQNGPQANSYFDLLGREIQSTTQGFAGTTIKVDTQYDAYGRVAQKSRPYFSGGTVKWIANQYDTLGRVTRVTEADNSYTQYGYAALVSSVTNSLFQVRTKTKNSQGQVVQSKDELNNTTTFAYDPFGNLTSTTDAAGNVSTIAYNVRGHKTAMNDPDMGAWSYVNDVLGQLVQQTDAKSQVTTFTYDKLGRMLTRTEADLASTWTYDTATKGVGKIASATGSTNSYSRTHSYDSLGRPSSVAISIDGTVGTGSTTYDAQGRVDTLVYPSGFAVKQVYTALGFLSEVRNNATSDLYWRADTADAEGHLTGFTHGNGVATTQGWDANTGRLTSIQAGPSNAVQNMTYSYDTLGSLQVRTDATQNVVENFDFDALNRLTYAEIVDGAPGLNFAYNAIGNITTKDDVGTYTYPTPGSARPHAVSSISGTVNTSFTYDNNGNLLTGNSRTLTWTSFNMPATIARGTATLSFSYDPEHDRIKQVAPDGTTLYFGGVVKVEKFTGTGGTTQWNNYIYAAGGIVAVFYEKSPGPSLTRYFHKDHLGSIAVITDEAGAVVERDAYDAWGKRRYPNGAADPTESIVSLTNRGFTGHEHLEEVGLVHMNGRVYDPLVARFMSADPTVQDPFNTQSLNRYTYVINNPLAYTDPNGYFFESLFKGIVNFIGSLGLSVIPGFNSFVASNSWFASILQVSSGYLFGAVGASFTSAYLSNIHGGSLGDMFKAAAITFGTTMAFYGVGSATGMHSTTFDLTSIQPEQISQLAINVAGHAAVGCASAVASGGGGKGCGPGALAAGFSAVAGPFIPEDVDLPYGVAISAAVGGTASVLGGGKFENGAITAAFGYLYNQQGGGRRTRNSPEDLETLAPVRVALWNRAISELRALEPNNPKLEYITGPRWVPSQQDIDAIKGEINEAQNRASLYPSKVGRVEQHHVVPLYVGGAVDGKTVSLDSAYHQVVTNQFRSLWPYGQTPPTVRQLEELMNQVYGKHPLPGQK